MLCLFSPFYLDNQAESAEDVVLYIYLVFFFYLDNQVESRENVVLYIYLSGLTLAVVSNYTATWVTTSIVHP